MITPSHLILLWPGEQEDSTSLDLYNQVMGNSPLHIINSPNNWLVKAGAYVDTNNSFHMPMKCVLFAMSQASEGVEEYEAATNYGDKMKAIQRISLCVRSADTAYFMTLAENVNAGIPATDEARVCQYCLRIAVSPKLKGLRDDNNEKIIHGMEKAGVTAVIHPSIFPLALQYYNAFMELPLMDFRPIGVISVGPCVSRECKKAKVQ